MQTAIKSLCVLFIFSTTMAFAVTNTWLSANGTGNSTKWGRTANWCTGAIPTASDTVIIPTTPANGTGFPVLDVSANARILTIQTGASVTGAAGLSLTVAGPVTIMGTGTLNGGGSTVTIAGSVSGTGTLNADAGTINMTGNMATTFVGGTSTVSIGGNVTSSSFNGGASTINVAGNITATTFTAGTSTVVLNGTSVQSLGGYTFNNLTVNNPAGVNISSDITVNGTLTLTSGVVTTGSNKIQVTSNLVGAVVATNGHVNGELQRPVVHPPGGPARVYVFTDPNTSITLPASTSVPQQTISVISYPGTQAPNQQGGVGINRYYTITVPDILTATLSLAYLDSELNGVGESDLAMFRYQGAWGMQNLDSTTIDSTNNFVQVTGVSNWSDWTLGSRSNPLPIQLGSFTGVVLSNGLVRLDWMTLSELNNYGFEVQKSADGSDYQTIPNSFIEGHGTTPDPHYYTYTDVTATPGHLFYRLKQYDLDGTIHYTEGIEIDNPTGVGEGKTMPTAFAVSQNYPNPFNPSTTIKFALPEKSRVTLKVYNLLGKEVATITNADYAAGYHQLTWTANDVASGVYFYRIQAGNFVETRKLTLIK